MALWACTGMHVDAPAWIWPERCEYLSLLQATRYPMPSPGDKLLTLHEVATSPMPYAAKSYINATDMTIHGSTAKQRKKLSVAIPEEEGKLQV